MGKNGAKSEEDAIAALRAQTLETLRKIPEFDGLITRAMAVAADMDEAYWRCRFRGCRRHGFCRAVVLERDECGAALTGRGRVAAEACTRFFMRGLLETLPPEA